MARAKEEPAVEAKIPTNKATIRSIRSALNKDDADKVTWDLSKDDSPTYVKEFIPTGSTLLDYVMTNRRGGGVPVGKMTAIEGEEQTGKSLLCAHIIANAQRMGGIAVYIDTENAANPDFMKRVGVDLESLVYIQPGTVEHALEHIEAVIRTLRAKSPNTLVCILWDSIGGTPTQAEIEGDYDPNSQMGLLAKTLSKGFKKLIDLVAKERIALVVTNHLKQKMGYVMGDPFYAPGGKGVPYLSTVRLRLTSSTKLKDEKGDIYGVKTNGRVIKTRLGPNYRSTKFEIHFDQGVDDERSWLETLQERGGVENRGGWRYPVGLPEDQKFREKEWPSLAKDGGSLRTWALDALERLMVVKYEKVEGRQGVEVPNSEVEGGDDIIDDGEAA